MVSRLSKLLKELAKAKKVKKPSTRPNNIAKYNQVRNDRKKMEENVIVLCDMAIRLVGGQREWITKKFSFEAKRPITMRQAMAMAEEKYELMITADSSPREDLVAEWRVKEFPEIKRWTRAEYNLMENRLGQLLLERPGLDKLMGATGQCVKDLLIKNGFTQKECDDYCVDKKWTGNMLADFCRLHNRSCYLYDMDYALLSKFVGNGRQDKRVIMGLIADNHIYEITSEKKRRTVQFTSMTTKRKVEKKLKAMPYEKLPEVLYKYKGLSFSRDEKLLNEGEEYITDNIDYDKDYVKAFNGLKPGVAYYIPDGHQDLIKVLVYIIKEFKIVPKVKCTSKHLTNITFTKPGDKEPMTFYYNEHIRDVIDACKLINVPFANQSVTLLAKGISGDLSALESSYDLETRAIFDNMVCGGKNWCSVDKRTTKMKATDIAKCYSSIARDYDLPVLDIFSNVSDYNGVIEGWLFIETTDTKLFKGNGWYWYPLVKMGLDDGIPLVIKYQIKCGVTSVMRSIVEKIYKKYPTKGKSLVNCLIGSFGCKSRTSSNIRFCVSWSEAMYYKLKDASATIESIHVNDSSIYKVTTFTKTFSTKNCLPAYNAVVQLGWLKVYELSKIVPGPVVAVKTDCVVYIGKSFGKGNSSAKIGDYRKESIGVLKKFTITPSTEKYEKKIINGSYKEIGKFDNNDAVELLKYDSLLVNGKSGYGKTYLMNMMRAMCPNSKLVAFTNLCISRFNDATTIHKLLKKSITGSSNIVLDFDTLFIDEVSMIPASLFEDILYLKSLGVKIYMYGDFLQYEAVKERSYEFDEFMNQLCDGNKIMLTHCYRSDASYVEKVIKGAEVVFNREGDTKLNIAYSNAKVDKVNSDMAKIYGGKGSIGSYVTPLFTKVSMGIFKNGIYEVVGDKKIKQKFVDSKIITIDSFSKFKLAYCVTSHKAQGLTFNENYNIYELESMSKAGRYVSLTRCTNPNQIRVISFSYSIENIDIDLDAIVY